MSLKKEKGGRGLRNAWGHERQSTNLQGGMQAVIQTGGQLTFAWGYINRLLWLGRIMKLLCRQ